MRAIQFTAPRQMRRVDVASPSQPGPGQVLVRTHRMGVCGTDVSAYLGKFPFFEFPRIPGHELGVEVVAVGEGVAHVRPGDRCSVEPYMNCGTCYACRRGHTNCCERLNVIGVMSDGGLCEQFLIRGDKLHPSQKLSFEQLALVETLAIGCHATDRGAAQADEHVMIIGVGPIGLATLEFTRLTQARLTIMDTVPQRLEFCRRVYGIEHTILFQGDGSEREQMADITGGDMYALVTDATGNQNSMSGAPEFVAHSGTLLFVGITNEEISLPHPSIHRREMTIKGSRNAVPGDFTKIIRLIEEGTVDTTPWVTHRTTFDELPDAFDAFTRPETGVLKAVIDVAG